MSAARHRRHLHTRLLTRLKARFCTWLEPLPTGPLTPWGDRWETARTRSWRTW